MVAHEKRNSGQLFCTVLTRNDLALSSLLFTAQPTKKLGYPPAEDEHGKNRGFVESAKEMPGFSAVSWHRNVLLFPGTARIIGEKMRK